MCGPVAHRPRRGNGAVTAAWSRAARLLYVGLGPARVPTGIDFRILGPLEVLDEGRAVTLGGSKQRALLAMLLLHANETLSTDRLIDELWGERPPANAAKALQVHISRLRKSLGRGTPPTCWLRPRRATAALDRRLDSPASSTLPRAGELAARPPGARRHLLSAALALWRGRPAAPTSPTSPCGGRSPGSTSCGSPRWSS